MNIEFQWRTFATVSIAKQRTTVQLRPSASLDLFRNIEMNFEQALDENFDGFIAKGNNNFIEIILDGQGTFLVGLYFRPYTD